MLKRAFDCGCAAFGLVVMAPLFLFIALVIRLDSPGPAFFHQTRVGKTGKHFRILKFRTMAASQAPGSPQITSVGDNRITQVGEILRRYKLDELPQLVNVLVGDMSLVGPRPEVPKYVALYPPGVREIILSVRPGITDPASIKFRNEGEALARFSDPEEAYVTLLLPEKLALGVEYVNNRNLALDLSLLILTAKRILWSGKSKDGNDSRISADSGLIKKGQNE